MDKQLDNEFVQYEQLVQTIYQVQLTDEYILVAEGEQEEELVAVDVLRVTFYVETMRQEIVIHGKMLWRLY